jgi:hypothetical protein
MCNFYDEMNVRIKKGDNIMIHYNEKIIDATKRMSQETLNKSMDRVKKLSHPSKKVLRIGSKIGLVIGIVLIITGAVNVLLGHKWGLGSCLAGVTSVISNIINLSK